MYPIGFQVKKIAQRPQWLRNADVRDIYSVSDCVSQKIESDHLNRFGMHVSVEAARLLAKISSADNQHTQIFYYETFEYQSAPKGTSTELGAKRSWHPSFADDCLIDSRSIVVPEDRRLEGYDVVSYKNEHDHDCSLLCCNHIAEEVEVNEHCLLSSFAEARQLLERNPLFHCSSDPARIVAVYSVQ